MASQTSVYVDGAWKTVNEQYVRQPTSWDRVSDSFVYTSSGWKKVHEQPYNWRLWGASAATTNAYNTGGNWLNSPNYNFTPLYTESRLGNAVAGAGMPGSYNASFDGQVIWPKQSNEYGQGWVGFYCTPTTDTITIRAVCDNAFTLYLNTTQVLSGGDWRTFYTTTRTVVPNDRIYISIFCRDYGVLWGASCRVANGSTITGTALLQTSTSWVSR
jgi:hypothetical protein